VNFKGITLSCPFSLLQLMPICTNAIHTIELPLVTVPYPSLASQIQDLSTLCHKTALSYDGIATWHNPCAFLTPDIQRPSYMSNRYRFRECSSRSLICWCSVPKNQMNKKKKKSKKYNNAVMLAGYPAPSTPSTKDIGSKNTDEGTQARPSQHASHIIIN